MAIRGYKIPKNHERTPIKTPWLAGPLMKFQLEIDGQVIERQGHLNEFFEDGVYWIQAADDPSLNPRHFILNAHFPWYHFKPWLIHAWGSDPYLPFCLKPKKRIPEEIIENMKTLSEIQFIEIIQLLRKQGFLPKLRKLSHRLHRFPGELNWEEVRAHCFKAHPQTD